MTLLPLLRWVRLGHLTVPTSDVEIDGVRRPVLVSVGGDQDRPLLGYTTLEAPGFKVNPVTHALEPTRAIEL